jgi:hypothetical protein
VTLLPPRSRAAATRRAAVIALGFLIGAAIGLAIVLVGLGQLVKTTAA